MTHVAVLALGLAGLSLLALPSGYPHPVQTQPDQRPRLTVKPTSDFEVTGTGTAYTALQEVDQPAVTQFHPLVGSLGHGPVITIGEQIPTMISNGRPSSGSGGP